MTGSNNDVLSGGHRSVIEEHSVITFVAQIPGGKSKPGTDIGCSEVVSSGAFCPTSLWSDLLGCDLLSATSNPIETSGHACIL